MSYWSFEQNKLFLYITQNFTLCQFPNYSTLNQSTIFSISNLSESTDDYIYILFFENESIFFNSNIQEKYDLPNEQLCSLEDYLNIVYPADIQSLVDDLTEVAEGKKDSMKKNIV